MPIPIKARFARSAPAVFDTPPAVVLIGQQGDDTPRGSWFGREEAEQARRAAALGGFQVVSVRSAAQRELAGRVPRGRIFSSGKAFAPRIQSSVFEALLPHAKPAAKVIPFKAAGAVGGKAAAAAPADAPADGGGSSAKDTLPPDWARITVGHTVLAYSPEDESWFEAVIVRAEGDDLFGLRWRDFDDEPEFLRRRHQLALKFPADKVKAG